MNKNLGRVFAVASALALSALGSVPARAQTAEAKEKPPMYSYVAFWTIARPQWAEMEKQYAGEEKIMEKALASGTLVGYGNDFNLIHTADTGTHDSWFSSMSQAGLLNLLDQIYKSGTPTSPVNANAIKHSDGLYVSRFYNWHSGSWKDAYTHVSVYKLKADAPDDAIEKLSKNLFVPLLEKMLADGTIHEYEVDTEAIHTEAPGTFVLSYIAANAEALDKVSAAVRDTMKANPMYGPAFGSVVDFSAHRDFLLRTTATFK
jgi:hypothetical protein